MTALSSTFQEPAKPGTLVCVGGPAGAGKSTLGASLAQAAAMCLVDLDSVTTPLVEAFAEGLGAPADLDAPQFTALRSARYACLGQVVSDNLHAGRDVVAVAPFTREAADAGAWRAQALAWGAARVLLCWIDLDPAGADARLAARSLPRDVAKARRRGGEPLGGMVATGAGSPASAGVDRTGFDVLLDGRLDPAASVVAVLGAMEAGSSRG